MSDISETPEEIVSTAIKFESLYNFRDISQEGGKVAPGRIYRGANLCAASEQDAKHIVDTLKIKTLIDLRRSQERGVVLEEGKKLGRGMILGPLNPYFLGDKVDSDRGRRQYFNIPLTSGFGFNIAILGRTEPWAFCRALGKGLWYWDQKEIERGITESAFRKITLEEMYAIFLVNAKPQVFKIMEILANPKNHPVAFFCSGGKDRTALITMLVQGCCGEEPERVIASYHESIHNLQPIIEKLRAENQRDGLPPTFETTPKEAMAKTLEFINENWPDGISGYLAELGFTKKKQEQMRQLLSTPWNEE